MFFPPLFICQMIIEVIGGECIIVKIFFFYCIENRISTLVPLLIFMLAIL